MESIVLFLMILTGLAFLLKLTWHKPVSVWLAGLVSCLFLGLTWPLAIEQSRSRIEAWLADPQLMQDTAVILTLEVIVQMAFCLLAVRLSASGPVRRRTVVLYRILRWFPGILFFPVLFSLLVSLIFAFPGTSFPAIAWSAGILLLLLIPACTFLLRNAFPEKEVRLELFFLIQSLIALTGIVATVNGRTSIPASGSVDWSALAGTAAGAVILSLAGYLVFRHRSKPL